MAISSTATARATLCTASTNRIIQTGALNGLSFDFVFVFWVFFSQFRAGREKGSMSYVIRFHLCGRSLVICLSLESGPSIETSLEEMHLSRLQF